MFFGKWLNPLAAGSDYMFFFIFHQHNKYYILNIIYKI